MGIKIRVMGTSGPGALAWPPILPVLPNGPPIGLATAVPARIGETPSKVQIKDKISSRAESEKPHHFSIDAVS